MDTHQLAGILQLPGGDVVSPVGNPNVSSIGGVVSAFVPYIYSIAGILLLIFLIISGIRYLTSGGNPETMSQAREHIYAALIGFAIVFSSYFLLRFAEVIFHFRITSFIPTVHATGIDLGESFKLGGNNVRDYLPEDAVRVSAGGRLVGIIVNILFIVSGIIFIFIFVIGGLRYIFSGGDEKNIAGAKSQMTAGIIGILIVFSAFAIVRFIQFFTGVAIVD